MTTPAKRAARAVILAAGQGKRMKSTKAKVLHDVLGKPVLGRIIDALDALSLERIHIVVGHASEQVIDWLSSCSPKTPYSVHIQSPQLGTGHALQQVVPELKSFEGSLIVTVGDAPLQTAETLEKLLDSHQNANAVVSLLTTVVEDAKNYGRIVRDKQGKVIKIVEDKDATPEEKSIREINPAIYCFEWPGIASGLDSLKNDNRQAEYYLTDLIGWATDQGLPMASAIADDWREVAGINSRLELSEAIRLLRDRVIRKLALESGVTVLDPDSTWIAPEVEIGQDSTVLPGCHLIGNIAIGDGCLIGPHTVMEGAVRIGARTSIAQSLVVNSEIGDDCRVGPFAHVREHTVIANKCRIGNFVEIKKSEIDSNTNCSHLSYVGDATLGKQVNIGAGTITANYDHFTKLKSRTVIGDGSATGSNSVLVAPITIGKECSIAAGTVTTKDVPDGALAVARVRQENKEGYTARKKRGTPAVK